MKRSLLLLVLSAILVLIPTSQRTVGAAPQPLAAMLKADGTTRARPLQVQRVKQITLDRSTVDRPDEVGCAMVHFIYALASDTPDRGLEPQIAASVEIADNWLAEQTEGRSLCTDTFQGQVDLTFLRISRTEAEAAAKGGLLLDLLLAEAESRGLIVPSKTYGFYYDGPHSVGSGHGGGGRPAGVVYLGNAGQRAELPEAAAFFPATTTRNVDRAMLHELFHGFGFVQPPPCSRHYSFNSPGHVTDAGDIMGTGGGKIIDIDQDDYYGTNVPAGCPNLRDNLITGRYHKVTASALGDGEVQLDYRGWETSCSSTPCALWTKAGQRVTFTAEAYDGSRFASWNGACTNQGNPCALTASGPLDVTATFAAIPMVRLTVKIKGRGQVTDTQRFRCLSGGRCRTIEREQGSLVTLKATPARGWSLKAWRGTSCSARSSTCRIALTQHKTITVEFQPPKCRPGQKSTASRPCRK